MRTTCIVILLAMTTACRPTPPAPVEIEPYDMCAFCRMALSQKQFTAEIIDAGGTAYKFDDIGCMLRYRKRHPETVPAAIFVVDYGSRQWLAAESAVFVHTDRIRTPMGGGFIAFRDAAAARSESQKFNTPVLRLAQLEAGEEVAP